jgi:hypothetical protein
MAKPKRKPYYATMDRNGTEDEIAIRTPDGRVMAYMQFWDEPDIPEAKTHKDDATLIVKALNAYRRQQVAGGQNAVTGDHLPAGPVLAEMSDEVAQALSRVVDYLWQDEMAGFAETSPAEDREGHVFLSLRLVRRWLGS